MMTNSARMPEDDQDGVHATRLHEGGGRAAERVRRVPERDDNVEMVPRRLRRELGGVPGGAPSGSVFLGLALEFRGFPAAVCGEQSRRRPGGGM